MLVVFRVGPKGDQTMDVIDVIPRAKEAIIKQRGLGKKAKRFFWVEVDTHTIADEGFNALACQLTEAQTQPGRGDYAKPGAAPRARGLSVKAKRKHRLDQRALEKLDPSFNAATAIRTHDASRVYPKQVLSLGQLKSVIKNKRTGRHLNGD